VALRDIRRYQKSTALLIPKLSFARLVKEITYETINILPTGYWSRDGEAYCRWSKDGMLAIQEAAEAWLTNMFTSVNLLSIHRNRITINKRDMTLYARIALDFIQGSSWHNYVYSNGSEKASLAEN
jgi:histone H3